MIVREKHIPNGAGIGIVDFDNVLGDFFDVNNSELLISSINTLLRIVHDSCPSDYYVLRLYSGWMQNGNYTNKASTVLQTIGSAGFFPNVIDGKIIQGEIQLASSLNSIDDLIWGDTYVRRRGLPHLRIETETLAQHCNQENDGCPAKLLRKFSKTPNKKCFVDGCSVINSQAFVVGAQKMVDTMMATDIVDYCHNQNVEKVCIFSDDTDLMPPIMRGHLIKENKVAVFMKNGELISRFEHLQTQYGLELNKIEI